MARRRKTKAKKGSAPTVEDVLDGKVDVRMEDLFDLIHEVNPTLRKLPQKEAARRYALKNRLQSLLIRRFGDEHLTVEPTVRPGVVSLNHYSGARDACHAVAAELEPDARAWIRRQLDLAASPSAEASEPWMEKLEASAAGGRTVDEMSAGELLESGRRAVAEYDYEAAEELLSRAFDQRPGVETALALLELRVDHLGMDAQALAIEPRLPATASEHSGVRALLALAAARRGDAERALGLVKGLAPAAAGFSAPRTAEVYVALAARAVAGHDRRAARKYLELAAEHDATHPEIPRLGGEIDRLRAADLRRVEAELDRRYRQQGCFAVEEEARALAGRWPDSEVARQILRQAGARRREAEIAEHLAAGDRAFDEGRHDAVARHYQAAIDAGSERPDLAARIDEARRRLRERQEEQRVDDVLRRFDDGSRDAWLAYLALPEDLRAPVRRRLGRPALAWLDEMGAPASGAKAQAAVAAVQALERAQTAAERGADQDALAELQPHRDLLRGVERARNLYRELRTRVEAERRRRAREALDAAWASYDGERPKTARRLLRKVELAHLAAPDRSRAEELRDRLRHAGAVERLEHEYEDCLAGDDPTGALYRARRLTELVGDEAERRRWQAGRRRVQQRLRDAWQVEVIAEDAPLATALPPSHSREKSLRWLDDQGRELVLAVAWDEWLFLTRVDVREQKITARVSLRTPRPLVVPLLTSVDGDRLWITGRHGDVLEIDRRDWSILGYYRLDDFISEDREVDGALVLPGGVHVWMHVSDEWGESETWVVDLREWRVVRQLPSGTSWYVPLVERDRVRVLFTGTEFGAKLYSPEGHLLTPDSLVPCPVSDAAPTPEGAGLLMLMNRDDFRQSPFGRDDDRGEEEDPDDDGDEERARHRRRLASGSVLVRFDPTADGTYRPAAKLPLPEGSGMGFNAVVTSVDRGLSFVNLYCRDRGRQLMAFTADGLAAAGGELEPAYRVPLPGWVTLAQDWQGDHVVAVLFAEAMALADLGAEPPEVDWSRERWRSDDYRDPGRIQGYFPCDKPMGEMGAAIERAEDLFKPKRAWEIEAYFAALDKDNLDADRVTVIVLAALRSYLARDAAVGFLRRAVPPTSRHLGLRLARADVEARAENWKEVRRLLGGAKPPADFDGGRARHFYHLQGLGFLYTGKMKKAYAAFKKGAAVEGGTCDLGPYLVLTEPMKDPPKESEWSPDQPVLRQTLGALRTADRALAAGDPEAAREALDRNHVRWHAELQLTARRARAYLGLPAATPVERFHKRAALAYYCHVRHLDDMLRREIDVPGLAWDEGRLEALEVEVRDWLHGKATGELGTDPYPEGVTPNSPG